MPSTGLNPRFHHVSMSVADLAAQQRWYQQTLGFTEVIEDYELPDDPVRTVVLQCDSGLRIELVEADGSSRVTEFSDPLDASRIQGYAHWALEVDDLDHAFVQVTTFGGRSVWPPAAAAQPGAHFAYVKDPEGNLIELIQPAPATFSASA